MAHWWKHVPHDLGVVDVPMGRNIDSHDEVSDLKMLVSQLIQEHKCIKLFLGAWNSIWMHGYIKHFKLQFLRVYE